jgi:3-oxoacyl-[acyl-carrier protein] reductase
MLTTNVLLRLCAAHRQYAQFCNGLSTWYIHKEGGGYMRTVLVTGSSRGIGFGIAKAFAKQGDRVVLNGKSDATCLNAAMEALNGEGFLADMADYASAKKLMDALGPVDVLVNNAGAASFGLFTDTAPPDWDAVIAANLLTVLNATHLAVPSMVKRKAGAIINVTSVWGITGASCEAVYAAAKAGVHGFTKSMARELGPSGIRVNAIACGAFNTRMNDRLTPREKNAFTEGIPLCRFGEPEEAGALAVFLASEEAGYLTGQVLALDGGLV